MSPRDASIIGFKDSERITLPLDKGRLEIKLRIVDNMAPGVIVMPRHRQLAWQKIEKWPLKVVLDQIRK
jgi:predicted molibdopterin-dependent oxidoreductase YjgC